MIGDTFPPCQPPSPPDEPGQGMVTGDSQRRTGSGALAEFPLWCKRQAVMIRRLFVSGKQHTCAHQADCHWSAGNNNSAEELLLSRLSGI
jgi:hypothetical protein